MKFFQHAFSLLFVAANLGCHSTGGPTAQSAGRAQPPDNARFNVELRRAEQGDAEAQYYVGKYYSVGRGGTGDLAQAVSWFREAAEQNDSKAQNALGVSYLHGRGASVDIPKAVRCFEKASAQGNADAQAYLLGLAFFEIPFVTNDYAKAGDGLRKSALQGNAVAQGFLGLAYVQGHRVTKSEVEAVEWFRKAAEQGQTRAQAFLGHAYFRGHGVATNYARAINWSRKAAEQGEELAQETLGHCYQEGKGVEQNAVEAVKWFRRSAELGDEEAQLALGLAYRDGRGAAQDYVRAYKWLDLAAVQGNIKAISARKDLPNLMTARQLAQAGAAPRRQLISFDRKIIDDHRQRYSMSCIPSSVEMVLKLLGRVPGSYYEQQTAWKNKADGSFHDFDGKTIEGLTFQQKFTQPHGDKFPLVDLFEAIDHELNAGRFVIVGLPCAGDTHDWVIYDEATDGDFLAVSKAGSRTMENNHVRKTITEMQGTDIGVYR